MSIIAELFIKVAAIPFIKKIVTAIKKEAFPEIIIRDKLIYRENNTVVILLEFYPIDIIRITAPGRKIQIAQFDIKMYDDVPGIVVMGFYEVYNQEKSGGFTDAITKHIRILPKVVKEGPTLLNIAISDDGADKIPLTIKTEQNMFSQKFVAILKKDED